MIKKEKTKRAAPSPSSVIDVKCTPSVGVLRVHLCRCFFTGPCPASGARVGATVVCPWSTVVPCTAGRNTNFPARASARPWVEQRKTVTLLCVSVCHPSIHQLATQRQSLSSELVRCRGRGFCPFWPGPCVCVCVCVSDNPISQTMGDGCRKSHLPHVCNSLGRCSWRHQTSRVPS